MEEKTKCGGGQQSCELTEQELEGAAGGATKDRYDKDKCPAEGFRNDVCKYYTVFNIWCDHFRQVVVEDRPMLQKLVHRSCAMHCFRPFTQVVSFYNAGEQTE